MGMSSLQADNVTQSRKKRSFSLPSFRRSSAGERQEAVRSVEEAARTQKAAAWQWHTRGVGEAVLPTKRPSIVNAPPSQPPIHDRSGVDRRLKGGEAVNVLQKKPLEPPLADSPRSASRFKAEAALTRPIISGAVPTPPGAPSTPLYDEFELSGLRTQMADFVQRLHHQQTEGNVQSPAVAHHQTSKKYLHTAVDSFPFPAATSVSNDHQQITPPVAAATSSDHHLTKLPPSAAPVASANPFHMRPFAALHRLFRKVVSGSTTKRTNNSLLATHISSPAVYEPEVLPEDAQFHYHHYIHHHHHHYHYDQSPEESAATMRSRRRHSESSSIHPRLPRPWEAEANAEEGENEIEESPIDAYLARRRRYSDSFAGHVPQKRAPLGVDEAMKGDFAKVALPSQSQRWYSSERFPLNKIPTMVSKELTHSKDEFDEGQLRDIRSSRRRSADNNQEEASLGSELEGGGKSGGGTYKLGGAAGSGKLLVCRRRHSETLQRPEVVHYETGKCAPSPGRPNWQSSSVRYYEDVLKSYISASAPPANTMPACLPRPSVLPPLYPK